MMPLRLPAGLVSRVRLGVRLYSVTAEEAMIQEKLSKALQPKKLQVMDISGGCGSMFAIEVSSEKFRGLSIVKQHKMVNEILKQDIPRWHGLQLRTKAD